MPGEALGKQELRMVPPESCLDKKLRNTAPRSGRTAVGEVAVAGRVLGKAAAGRYIFEMLFIQV